MIVVVHLGLGVGKLFEGGRVNSDRHSDFRSRLCRISAEILVSCVERLTVGMRFNYGTACNIRDCPVQRRPDKPSCWMWGCLLADRE
jgi:hypothetical protein